MINSQSFQMQRASDSYTDVNSVQSLRSMKDKNQALGEISKQFESMMVRMMLKSMREANKVFAQDNPFSSDQTEFYQNMMDDQLALSLSQGKGMGLAETMQRQLGKSLSVTGADRQSVSTDKHALPEKRLPVLLKLSPKAEVFAPIEPSMPREVIQLNGSPEDFAKQLHALAGSAAKQLNVEPETLLAQAALETGWGKKVTSDSSGRSSYNLFNIKADKRWQGDTVTVPTLEFRNGVAVKETATFRAYDSYEQSFSDYVALIRDSARYQSALQAQDGKTYVRELAKNGYATDPNYAEKISRIMDSAVFQRADSQTQLAQASRF
jgi:flagellar protein FlgJ